MRVVADEAGTEDGADEELWRDRDTADLAAHIDRWMLAHLDRLFLDAEQEVMRVQARLVEAGRVRPESERARVGVRVRRQTSPLATPGSFGIEWVSYRWVHRGEAGKGGAGRTQRTCFTKYIRRSKEDRYQRGDYRGIARPWQIPLIMEAEERFARIRTLSRRIAQVRAQLRIAVRAEQAFRERLSADPSEWED